VIVELVASVALLTGLEAALRVARRDARSRIKYLVLGLGGLLLGRFYFLSRVALFNVEMASYLVTTAAILLIGNMAIAVSMARDRLGVELTVSRRVLYRSVVVGTLGVYLVAVGLLGWVLNQLGVAEELFLGSIAVFVSALGLAAVLLSETVRWRVKRFVARNFYRSKYDYREQWASFHQAPRLSRDGRRARAAAPGGRRGGGGSDRRHPLLEGQERSVPGNGRRGHAPAGHAPCRGSPSARRAPRASGAHRAGEWRGRCAARAAGSADVRGRVGHRALLWGDELTGVLLIGPEQTGAPYTSEDFELMETVGEQAAGVIVSARLSESVAQSREFEAFHRLTSFVIHDLKNSISALSMLSENALKNFDDPEFQHDVLKTVAKTVDRMKTLLGRLSWARQAAALRVEPVDLAVLVMDAARPLARSDRIALIKDLAPTPISADVEALSKVIQNLITNAVQAIDGNGTVTLNTFAEGGRAVFSITDTGCGMSEEFVRNSLFTPFRSTKNGGWGIGLYHAKELVEAHGGSIDVSSKEGAGTTILMQLPIGERI
jgi:signal transduction histidine kinase